MSYNNKLSWHSENLFFYLIIKHPIFVYFCYYFLYCYYWLMFIGIFSFILYWYFYDFCSYFLLLLPSIFNSKSIPDFMIPKNMIEFSAIFCLFSLFVRVFKPLLFDIFLFYPVAPDQHFQTDPGAKHLRPFLRDGALFDWVVSPVWPWICWCDVARCGLAESLPFLISLAVQWIKRCRGYSGPLPAPRLMQAASLKANKGEQTRLWMCGIWGTYQKGRGRGWKCETAVGT